MQTQTKLVRNMQNSLNTFDVHFVYKMFFEIVVYSTRICKFKFIFLQLITGIKSRDSSNLYHIKLLLVYIHINKYKDLQTFDYILFLADCWQHLQCAFNFVYFGLWGPRRGRLRATQQEREKEARSIACWLCCCCLQFRFRPKKSYFWFRTFAFQCCCCKK